MAATFVAALVACGGGGAGNCRCCGAGVFASSRCVEREDASAITGSGRPGSGVTRRLHCTRGGAKDVIRDVAEAGEGFVTPLAERWDRAGPGVRERLVSGRVVTTPCTDTRACCPMCNGVEARTGDRDRSVGRTICPVEHTLISPARARGHRRGDGGTCCTAVQTWAVVPVPMLLTDPTEALVIG